MPLPLQQGYPSKLSDDELEAFIPAVVDVLREQIPDGDVSRALPELGLALAIIGINDQARRQLVSGSRIAFGSLLLAAAAVVVSLVALLGNDSARAASDSGSQSLAEAYASTISHVCTEQKRPCEPVRIVDRIDGDVWLVQIPGRGCVLLDVSKFRVARSNGVPYLADGLTATQCVS